jgi:hypothetical protein
MWSISHGLVFISNARIYKEIEQIKLEKDAEAKDPEDDEGDFGS